MNSTKLISAIPLICLILLNQSCALLNSFTVPQVNTHIAEGNHALDQNKFETAIRHYDQAIEINPRIATPHYNRGIALFTQGEYEQALEDFDKAKTKLSSMDQIRLSDILVMRGRTLYLLKRYEEAVDDYSYALRQKPRHAAALNNRGITYNKLKQYEKALEDLYRAIELEPEVAGPHCNLGLVKSELKQYQEALRHLNHSLKLKSNFSLAYNNRAMVYRSLEKHDLALTDLSDAIRINYDWGEETGIWDAYFNRATLYMEMGQNKKALADVEQALRYQPTKAQLLELKGQLLTEFEDLSAALVSYEKALENIEDDDIDAHSSLYLNRSYIYFRAGEYRKALEDLNRSMEGDTVSAKTYALRGDIHYQLKDYSSALLDFNKALEEGSDDPLIFYSRAMLYFETGEKTKAIQDFEQLENHPNAAKLSNDIWGNMYLNRGLVKSQLKDPAGALMDFTKAIELTPNNSLAYANRASVHMELQNYESLLSDLDSALHINENWGSMEGQDLYAYRGVANLELKRYAKAIQDFYMAIEHDPNNLDLYFNRSLAFFYLHKYVQAKVDLEQILKIKPDYPNAKNNLKAVMDRM